MVYERVLKLAHIREIQTRECVTDHDRQIYYFRPNSMKKLDGDRVVILVVVVVDSCYLYVSLFQSFYNCSCFINVSFNDFNLYNMFACSVHIGVMDVICPLGSPYREKLKMLPLA